MSTASVYDEINEELNQVIRKLSLLSERNTVEEDSLLMDSLEHVLSVPGKRTRPAITILASKFQRHESETPITMAAAVELLHIATLIHDDTVDNSSVRRGKATVSNKWGEDVAILLGDYVFATSATLVCDTNNIRVIKRFSETIMELSSGELSEISDAFKWNITMESYLKRIYNKTASLFSTAAESGSVLSGAPETQNQALKSYGYNLGMSFQIIDDILDFEGEEKEVGKPVGNDLIQGTMTLPSILLVQQHPENNHIRKFFENTADLSQIANTIDAIQNSDIIPQCYSAAIEYSNKAQVALENLPNCSYKTSLCDLATYVVERRF